MAGGGPLRDADLVPVRLGEGWIKPAGACPVQGRGFSLERKNKTQKKKEGQGSSITERATLTVLRFLIKVLIKLEIIRLKLDFKVIWWMCVEKRHNPEVYT